MDLKKLQYDLSMQCTLIDILKNNPEAFNGPEFDLRTYIMDKFESYYHHFSTLSKDRWEPFENLDKDN